MKRNYLILVATVGLAGCAGLGDLPYNAQSPAAKISESQTVHTNSPTENQRVIVVPVVAGDAQTSKYISFSDVRVEVNEKPEQKTVNVYSAVSLKCVSWRVALVKDGKEIHHFTTSNRPHFAINAIPLEPLALDPNLPVPDRIVVSRIVAEQD